MESDANIEKQKELEDKVRELRQALQQRDAALAAAYEESKAKEEALLTAKKRIKALECQQNTV